MNCKDKIDKIEHILSNVFVQSILLIFTNLIFLSRISIPSSLLSKYFEPSESTVADSIAILSVLALAVGVLYYAGINYKTRKEYRIRDSPLSFRDRSVITGAILIFPFIVVIALSKSFNIECNGIGCYSGQIIFSVIISFTSVSALWVSQREAFFKNLPYHLAIYLAIFGIVTFIAAVFPELILLYYILTICLLVIGFGILEEKYREKDKNFTLKIIDDIYPRYHLELYQITSNDYRFKDPAGNEFIIPIEQVREIRYKK